MVKIDKNVPIPHRHNERIKKYPIADMKVGDSILINRKSRESVYYQRAKTGFVFTMRKEGKDKYRIWRVA